MVTLLTKNKRVEQRAAERALFFSAAEKKPLLMARPKATVLFHKKRERTVLFGAF